MIKPKPHNHSFGYNAVHIVFVTKYRHPVITDAVEARLKEMFTRLCKTQDSELLEHRFSNANNYFLGYSANEISLFENS